MEPPMLTGKRKKKPKKFVTYQRQPSLFSFNFGQLHYPTNVLPPTKESYSFKQQHFAPIYNKEIKQKIIRCTFKFQILHDYCTINRDDITIKLLQKLNSFFFQVQKPKLCYSMQNQLCTKGFSKQTCPDATMWTNQPQQLCKQSHEAHHFSLFSIQETLTAEDKNLQYITFSVFIGKKQKEQWT